MSLAPPPWWTLSWRTRLYWRLGFRSLYAHVLGPSSAAGAEQLALVAAVAATPGMLTGGVLGRRLSRRAAAGAVLVAAAT